MLASRQEVNRELIVRLSWYCSSSLRSSRLFFYGCDSPFLVNTRKTDAKRSMLSMHPDDVTLALRLGSGHATFEERIS
jgi:hypothetical protein